MQVYRSLALPRASLHFRTSSRNHVAPGFCFFVPSCVSKLPPKYLKVRDWRSLALPRASCNKKHCCAMSFCSHPFLRTQASDKGMETKKQGAKPCFLLRKVRDSNPRNPEGFNRFRVCPVRPLRQLSAAKIQLFSLVSAHRAKFLRSVSQNVWRRAEGTISY